MDERLRPGYDWVAVSPTTRVLLPADINYEENYVPRIHNADENTEWIGREEVPLPLPYSRLLQRLVSRQCDVPLIMPANNSITVTFDASRTYRCGASGVAPPESRFMAVDFAVGGDSGLNMYGFTWNGQHLYGFCLDHTRNMPSGPYANISMEAAMPRASRQVQLAVSFAIAQAPLTITDDEGARELMEMLGAPCAYEVNGYDIWGMVQATIWCLLGQGSPDTVHFENCPEGTASPGKLQCLDDAMNALYSMAFDYANGSLDCGEVSGAGGAGGVAQANFGGCRAMAACGGCGSGNCGACGGGGNACTTCGGEEGEGFCPARACCGCQAGKLFVCYTGGRNTDQSDTYLVFTGCVNDMREHCGRILLGPFMLDASNPGVPSLEIVPCEGCPPVHLTLTDFCGCRLETPPETGQEFYIAFQPPCIRYCFDLKASMWTLASAVYYFRRPGANYLQPIGVPFEEERYRETSIHICIDLTPPLPPPPPPPPVEIFLKNDNNNNNNNNNDLNDNNSSNLLSNALESMLNSNAGVDLSGVLGGLLGGFGGPGGFGPGGPVGCAPVWGGPGMPGMMPGMWPGMAGWPGFGPGPGMSPCGPCAPNEPFCIPPPAFPPPRPCEPCPPLIPPPAFPPPCMPCMPPCPPPCPPPWPQPCPAPCPPCPSPLPQPCAPPCPPGSPPWPQPCAAPCPPGPPPWPQPCMPPCPPCSMPWPQPCAPPMPPCPPRRMPRQAVTDPRLLLPQVSSAPRPDFANLEFDDNFFRDWYQM